LRWCCLKELVFAETDVREYMLETIFPILKGNILY
jgi:hypothetical protein